MDIFWELRQQQQIERMQLEAGRSEQRAEVALQHIQQLETRVNQLVVINMALWALLKESTGVTDEQLSVRMKELQETEVRRTVKACPRCQKAMSQRHHRCLYCDFEPETTDAFGKVKR